MTPVPGPHMPSCSATAWGITDTEIPGGCTLNENGDFRWLCPKKTKHWDLTTKRNQELDISTTKWFIEPPCEQVNDQPKSWGLRQLRTDLWFPCESIQICRLTSHRWAMLSCFFRWRRKRTDHKWNQSDLEPTVAYQSSMFGSWNCTVAVTDTILLIWKRYTPLKFNEFNNNCWGSRRKSVSRPHQIGGGSILNFTGAPPLGIPDPRGH